MIGFKRKLRLNKDIVDNYIDKLLYIESEINDKLSDYPNFDGIDFVDVRAGGIQIIGFHKQVTHYSYGEQITIKYDFSNYLDAINQFVDMWKTKDNDKAVRSYKDFLDYGARYGWD